MAQERCGVNREPFGATSTDTVTQEVTETTSGAADTLVRPGYITANAAGGPTLITRVITAKSCDAANPVEREELPSLSER